MSRHAIGLLSGTSLDGIDAAVCRVERDGNGPFGYDVAVESFVTVPYDDEVRTALRRLCESGTVDVAAGGHGAPLAPFLERPIVLGKHAPA